MKRCDICLFVLRLSNFPTATQQLCSQRHRGAGEKTTNMCAIERE
jgi:hypothetical protein